MKPRILVVEDDDALREMLSATLPLRGFELLVAETTPHYRSAPRARASGTRPR